MVIREAEWRDLQELVALEKKLFTHDRIDADEFLRYISKRVECDIFVAREAGFLTGYGVMIYPKKSTAGYLYSIASESRKGWMILQDLETAARDKGRTYVRLEVKAVNAKAIEFYYRNGYNPNKKYRHGIIRKFYEDGSHAMSLIKRIRRSSALLP